jgi:hypothetical protein
VRRTPTTGRLVPGFAGFSFEKTHITDGFFTPTNAPLIALFKLLGPGIMRIGANDVDRATWDPSAPPVAGGMTSLQVGTMDVDSLAEFLRATGWQVIYGVNMKTSTPAAAVSEAQYVTSSIAGNLFAFEIGNEINYFGSYASIQPRWSSFATAIHAALPNARLAGPATDVCCSYPVEFAHDDASQLVLLTQHYYRASAATSSATIANLLAIDPNVATESETLSAAASADHIQGAFRWGETNSFSGHGKAGVSNAFASALWGVDFMFNTAQYGSAGVNFHGGGENMDNNTCTNGPASCTFPFLYSPINEASGQVLGAAPLYYAMLFVSQTGVGSMLSTTAKAASLEFTGYSVALADGSTNVALINKDESNGVDARVDLGIPAASASAWYLQAPSVSATSGVTFAGASVRDDGTWNAKAPFAASVSGNVVTVLVPPASAMLVHAR